MKCDIGNRKIVFLNRFFWPDHSATAQLLTDLAFHLASEGQSVSVITSRLRYDGIGVSLPADEIIHGVSVKRVWTTDFGRRSTFGRLIDYFSYYVMANIMLWRLARAADWVVVMTDPPLLSIVASYIVKFRRARVINWLQDVFPEVAAQAGMKLAGGRLSSMIIKLRDNSLRSAEMNVSIGYRMAEYMALRGVSERQSIVIPNWADQHITRDFDLEASKLRNSWGLSASDIIVGYSGNLGIAHDFLTIIDAASIIEKYNTNIKFLFIGGGSNIENLKSEIKNKNLSNFRFQPYQSLDILPISLRVPDIHWLTLNPDMEGFIVPSKFYGIIAAGRPVIFVGDQHGEIASIIETSGCGKSCLPGKGVELASIIKYMAEDVRARESMAFNARQLAANALTRETQLSRWSKLLIS